AWTPSPRFTFARLAIGAHTMQLRARDADGVVTARTAELRAHERDLVAARDAAESANRAKSVFLASMSHELRTPLNAILGYAQILRQSPRLEPDQRRQLDTVHASGDHLLHLINDVLDLAKIEAGKVELAPQPVSLSRLLAHLTEVFEPRAAQKSLAWSLHGETPLPDLVLADEARLRQVLYNLLGNALKFTKHGRIELRVAAHEHRIRFTVADTGIGIAAADQAAIFGLFHQAAGPALSAHGAGLGLAISQRLVRLMGGEITVESSPGAGSRFSFAVELPPALGTPPAGTEKIPTGYRGPRRRVLVVDDEAVNREVLRALLAPLGFLVDEAETAEAALAQVAAHAPDLVLMDLRLRGLDGLAATRRLRALPHGAALRIIAISASVFPLDRAQALEAGCDEFEPKPFRAASLLAAIGRLLNLEWTTADSAAPFAPPETLPPDWRVPASSTLAQLEELADLGDLVAMRAALTAARATQPDTAPFLDTLAYFAAHAELAPLRAWIAAARARPISDSP
ncbi:MAG TPA: ATP-binding protein, partial [Opitutaceae bacterium]|nr:ATP-binding protein [Opitutaceae bacterium]